MKPIASRCSLNDSCAATSRTSKATWSNVLRMYPHGPCGTSGWWSTSTSCPARLDPIVNELTEPSTSSAANLMPSARNIDSSSISRVHTVTLCTPRTAAAGGTSEPVHVQQDCPLHVAQPEQPGVELHVRATARDARRDVVIPVERHD